jgi:antitoxin component of MazEF toxin-antitoxin module
LPHEETRKIIRIGDSYAVTMPRAWIRYNKLKGKDEVVVVSDGSVVINPPAKKEVPA